MSTATPTKETISPGLSVFLRRLTASGWDIEAPAFRVPPGVSYCFIGRVPASSPGGPRTDCLLYVYEGLREVRVDDLWRLVADSRRASIEHAVMCIGPDVALSEAARSTAARLQIRVLRLSD